MESFSGIIRIFMVDVETKQKFIELRAKGISYEKIAKELNVSKQTLINLSKELAIQISNYKEIEMDSLFEQYYVTKQKRVEVLGKNLELLQTELEKRDFNDIPTEKVLDMVLKYSTLLKNEYFATTFKEKDDFHNWDTYSTNSWVG